MKFLLAALLAPLLLAPAAQGAESEVTPVQKVLQLMENMLAKGKKEKHDEEVQYAAYKQFCDDTTAEKEKAIKEADEKIELLTADIEKYEATAARLTQEIAGHEADIAGWDADMKAATAVRRQEKAAYDDEHKDLSESISALERAIEVLKKQAYDRKQASFVQVKALQDLKLIPDDAKRAIAAFVQEDPAEEGLALAAPEAYGYEFQSHGIIDMLAKLLDKFFQERTTVEKEEADMKNAYKLTMQDLTAQVDQAKQDVEDKTQAKAKNLELAAEAKTDKKETEDMRAADKKYLEDLVATCAQKASDFESRQQLRAEELETIAKAIEIISSQAVTGNAEKYLPTLVQVKATSLAALRSEGDNEGAKMRAAAYLQERARATGSRVLAKLAERMPEDPFRKVKKMIKDLIVRLMEEANAEAEHKGWCDTELETNAQTRKEKTTAVEKLKVEIDELEASIQVLTQEIKDLAEAIEELDKAMAEATELRQAEKAENLQTIADAKEAQVAVAEALAVVKEFYAKAAEATALVQQQPTPPPIFDTAYKGMQGGAGGVVGFLEVIESDFARLEADTKAAEEAAQKEYDQFMTDSSADKEAKVTDHDHKEAKKEDQEQQLESKKGDLTNTQKELDAALAYFDKLKPSCVDAGVSYETRVRNRKEEIESLKEALNILNGESIP